MPDDLPPDSVHQGGRRASAQHRIYSHSEDPTGYTAAKQMRGTVLPSSLSVRGRRKAAVAEILSTDGEGVRHCGSLDMSRLTTAQVLQVRAECDNDPGRTIRRLIELQQQPPAPVPVPQPVSPPTMSQPAGENGIHVPRSPLAKTAATQVPTSALPPGVSPEVLAAAMAMLAGMAPTPSQTAAPANPIDVNQTPPAPVPQTVPQPVAPVQAAVLVQETVPEGLGLSFLGVVPQKPQVTVVFEIPGWGQQRAKYHAVIRQGLVLALVYDNRYDISQFLPPCTTEDKLLSVHLIETGESFQAHSTDILVPLGCLDIVVLLLELPDPAQEQLAEMKQLLNHGV